jgi:hypothetical protein
VDSRSGQQRPTAATTHHQHTFIGKPAMVPHVAAVKHTACELVGVGEVAGHRHNKRAETDQDRIKDLHGGRGASTRALYNPSNRGAGMVCSHGIHSSIETKTTMQLVQIGVSFQVLQRFSVQFQMSHKSHNRQK